VRQGGRPALALPLYLGRRLREPADQ